MSLNIVSELWFMVRDSLSPTDKENIAEQLVSLMIEENYQADEIKDFFKNDSDIKMSLQAYVDEENHVMNLDDWEEDDDFYDEDDSDDWS